MIFFAAILTGERCKMGTSARICASPLSVSQNRCWQLSKLTRNIMIIDECVSELNACKYYV